jgi:hypothetical protein
MSANETHLTVKDIAASWKSHPDTVREMFRDLPGVLKIIRPKTRNKRAYVTLRIPQSVVDRVYAKLTKAA